MINVRGSLRIKRGRKSPTFIDLNAVQIHAVYRYRVYGVEAFLDFFSSDIQIGRYRKYRDGQMKSRFLSTSDNAPSKGSFPEQYTYNSVLESSVLRPKPADFGA